MARKKYFEDFPVGHKAEFGSYLVTAEEIIEFASDFDPQSFHLDDEAARQTHFGGLIASGWHNCAMAMRMICDDFLLDCASIGSGGCQKVRWLKPVRPGDKLRMTREVIEARASKSRPDREGRGTLILRYDMYNQADEHVLTMDYVQLMLTDQGG